MDISKKQVPRLRIKTPPISIYAEPTGFEIPEVKIMVLIDKEGYSASSYMAGMCKGLDRFTLIGKRTGGGGGGNAGFELSNGWTLAISVSDFVDKDGISIELGVKPDIEIENTQEDLENNRDAVLEKALEMIKE